MRGGYIAAVSLVLCASWARAEPPAPDAASELTARELSDTGSAALEAGDIDAAIQSLGKSYELVARPETGLQLIQLLRKRGRLIEAVERCQQVAQSEIASTASVEERIAVVRARRLLPVLGSKVPRVFLRIRGADADAVRVSVDGGPPRSLPGDNVLALDPGRHRLSIRAHGRTVTRQVLLEGSGRTVLDASFDAPESGAGTLTWTAFGVGAAGLVTGIVGYGLASRQRAVLDGSCNDDRRCPESASGAIERYETFARVSEAGAIAGAGATLLGLVLLATR